MKNTFSLLSTYLSGSYWSLPTPRMSKISESCIFSADHPLVKWLSYRLFRFCSFCYVKKGEVFIGRPPLHGDRRYLRGGVHPRSEIWCVQ